MAQLLVILGIAGMILSVLGIITWFKNAKRGLLFMTLGNILFMITATTAAMFALHLVVGIVCFFAYKTTPPNHKENSWRE